MLSFWEHFQILATLLNKIIIAGILSFLKQKILNAVTIFIACYKILACNLFQFIHYWKIESFPPTTAYIRISFTVNFVHEVRTFVTTLLLTVTNNINARTPKSRHTFVSNACRWKQLTKLQPESRLQQLYSNYQFCC